MPAATKSSFGQWQKMARREKPCQNDGRRKNITLGKDTRERRSAQLYVGWVGFSLVLKDWKDGLKVVGERFFPILLKIYGDSSA
jgi:hypothetical protein